MTNYGVTDTSITTLGTNEFPNSSVFVPGDTKLTVLGGANKLTDGGGKTYAEALMHVADGSDVTQGTSTDANTVNSVMGRLTKIRDLLNASLAVTQSGAWNITNISGTVSLPTGASTSAKQPALGTAGTASTDVLTVQGIASMTALKVDGSGFTQPVSGTFWQATQPVSGTVTANAGSGTFTNQQSNITTDYDTGAGTQTMTMFGMALPASGGSVAGGTATNPIKTDPTGTTTQPVSGTVNATQSGTWTMQPGNTANTTAWKVDGSAVNQPVIGTKTNNSATPGSNNVGALVGIANAAAPTLTEGDQVLLSTDLSGSQRTTVTNANVNGQSTMANSAPIVIASDQTVIPTETWMMNQIKAGKGFMTGPNSTLATSTNASLTVLALSLFNPSLAKNVLIYSIELFTTENKGASANLIRTLTTDPGNGTGMTNALTVTNLKLGGSATAGVTAWTSPNGITASITPPGTAAWQIPSGGTQPSVDELLTNGTVILLPAGANNGIAVTTVVSVAADGFSCMAKWIEY